MTTINDYYPPKDGAVVTYEQSPHTSEETQVLQRGESIPVTPEEDEAFNRMGALE